jgi:hypothetical protein
MILPPSIRAMIVPMASAICLSAMGTIGTVSAEDLPTIEVLLQGDVFSPADIKVPANKTFILKVINREKAAVEIEAIDLKIEKVVAAGTEMTARVRPLKAGRYLIVNEYKEDTVKAFIVAE